MLKRTWLGPHPGDAHHVLLLCLRCALRVVSEGVSEGVSSRGGCLGGGGGSGREVLLGGPLLARLRALACTRSGRGAGGCMGR